MASTSRHHFSWVGHGFHPGAEHHWWFGPIAFGEVLQVTAHPVRRATQALVKDMRTRVDDAGNRTLLFTVRNVGANTIPGYGVDFSVVRG